VVAEARLDCLKAMGIEVWTPRRKVLDERGTEELSQAPLAADERDLGQPDWPALQEQVRHCSRCSLHETRTQTVFGVGDPEAAWMFVGEAPGEQEDLKGEPFVGRAGQLLDEMIRALDLTRETVYIANVLKCRPPRNRDPSPEESRACEPFLLRQVAWVKPSIIIAVGRIAAQNLLKTQTPIGKLRGVVHDYQGTPLVVTYHPAYLLRAQTEKRRAWEDLKLARRTLASLR
jgi:uracil-DNA glycosylase family 4